MREIGEQLYQEGGYQAMLDAFYAVQERFDVKAALRVERAWNGLRNWHA